MEDNHTQNFLPEFCQDRRTANRERKKEEGNSLLPYIYIYNIYMNLSVVVASTGSCNCKADCGEVVLSTREREI